MGVVELGIVVVVKGGLCIVVRCTETVEHAAEPFCILAFAKHLCQVAWRYDYAVCLVQVTVQAGDVAGDDLILEDVGTAIVRTTGDYGEVVVGDTVVQHLLLGEVYHHRTGVVHHHIDAVDILIPVGVVLWHQAAVVEMIYRINGIGRSLVLQCNTSREDASVAFHVRKHLCLDSVIQHGSIEELFLHRGSQFFVRTYAP